MKPALVWLFPAIFLIHDGEEAFTMVAWVRAHHDLLARVAGLNPVAARIVANMPVNQAAVVAAIGFELLIALAATIVLDRALRVTPVPRAPLYVYSGALAAYVIHVISHVGQTLALRAYTPGVFTATLVVPAVGGYLFSRLLEAGLLNRRQALISAAVGVLSILPIVATAHLVGRTLFPG